MLDNHGFDLWADGYDESVGLSDEENTYPFAGYKDVLNHIYNEILESHAEDVLDIGFGTGTLTAKLYEYGLTISGVDFSEKMFQIAQEKMPEAQLYLGDFSDALVPEVKEKQYDVIVATYSLHHLPDDQKVTFIKQLFDLLNDGGTLYIGDIAFKDREALEVCQAEAGRYWDDEEFYFVYDELKEHIPCLTFEQKSHCAAVMTLSKNHQNNCGLLHLVL